MTAQAEDFTNKFDKKSGMGGQDGVVSELTTFWTIKPGHEADMRAAVARFEARIRSIGPEGTTKTGIRDVRIAIFDNGTRALFATHFETDWDPYIDDIVLIVGMPAFLDWVQHTVEGARIVDMGREERAHEARPGRPRPGGARPARRRRVQDAHPGGRPGRVQCVRQRPE